MRLQNKKLHYYIYSLIEKNMISPLHQAYFANYLYSILFFFFFLPNEFILILTPHIKLRHFLFFEAPLTLPVQNSCKNQVT